MKQEHSKGDYGTMNDMGCYKLNDMSKINNSFSFQTYFKMCDNKTLRQTLIFILKVIYIAIYKEFGRYVTIISTYLVAISTLDLVQLFRIQACNPSQAKL